MKCKLIFCGLFALTYQGYSQETIDVQRPTLTESSTVIQKNFIQFENGGTADNNQLYDASTFVRFGVTKRIEARFFKSFTQPSFSVSGKVELLESKGFRPGFAVTGSYDPIFSNQDYRLCGTGSLGETVFYTLNAGYDGNPYGIILLGAGVNNFAFFGEFMAYDEFNQQLNYGITYILKNEVQFDIHSGLTTTDSFGNITPYFGGGISFKVK